MVLTDFNHADIIPLLATVELASMVETMPPREWMQKAIQNRIRTEPCSADWFYSYLNLCHDAWIESMNKPVKYRHCCEGVT